LLVTAGEGAVRLWEMSSGKIRHMLPAGDKDSYTVAFSPDERFVAAAGLDKTARLWDTASGKLLHQLRGHDDAIASVTFSRDSATLVTVSSHATRCWDVARGTKVKHAAEKTRYGLAAAFAPDGKTLALADEGGVVRLWDWASGKERWQIDAHAYRAHTLAFSPDGKTLATASADSAIGLWDVATGRSLDPTPGHRQRVRSVAYAADGHTIATAAWDGTVRLWDTAKGTVLRRFDAVAADKRPDYPDHSHMLADLALSPDGKLVATARSDNQVRVWDAATGKEVHRLPGHAVAFSPDGQLIAVGGNGTQSNDASLGVIRLHETVSGKQVHVLRGHLTGVAGVSFFPDGKTLLSRGYMLLGMRGGDPGESETKFLRLWDVATGRERRDFALTNLGNSVVLSPDARMLAGTGGRHEHTVGVTEIATGQRRLELVGHTEMLFTYAFAPDGRTLASGSMDGTVRLWDLASGQEIACLRGHRGWVMDLAFSLDGSRLVSASLDTTALVWDMRRYLGRQVVADLTDAELTERWADLAGDSAARAYRSLWALAGTGERTLPFLRERLQPVAPADPVQVARLIADLGSDNFTARGKATQELEGLGEIVLTALREARSRSTLEQVRRIDQVVDRIQAQQPTGTRLQALRGVEVLEHIGSAAARQRLRELACGTAEARLTREAAAALARLAAREP
jgi:WD40 repeat protein